VDGKPWPAQSAAWLRLPSGAHTIEPAARHDAISLIDLNAALRSASESGSRMMFEYSSDSRAIARFSRKPAHIEVDGESFPADATVLLPRGDHRVTVN
jgi:hypothetical protein